MRIRPTAPYRVSGMRGFTLTRANIGKPDRTHICLPISVPRTEFSMTPVQVYVMVQFLWNGHELDETAQERATLFYHSGCVCSQSIRDKNSRLVHAFLDFQSLNELWRRNSLSLGRRSKSLTVAISRSKNVMTDPIPLSLWRAIGTPKCSHVASGGGPKKWKSSKYWMHDVTTSAYMAHSNASATAETDSWAERKPNRRAVWTQVQPLLEYPIGALPGKRSHSGCPP